jgi:hypothetical protein
VKEIFDFSLLVAAITATIVTATVAAITITLCEQVVEVLGMICSLNG